MVICWSTSPIYIVDLTLHVPYNFVTYLNVHQYTHSDQISPFCNRNTCCFTNYRRIPCDYIFEIKWLKYELIN